MSDPTGFDSAPEHYAGEREAIDIIRDRLGDDGFVYWCLGNVSKYHIRSGKKSGTDDAAKSDFYMRMVYHIVGNNDLMFPDPRSNRPDFKPYERQAK